MNKLNERTIEPNDLLVLSSRTLDEQIEVFPDFFVNRSVVIVELTNAGRVFLQDIYEKFFSKSIDETYTIQKIREVAEHFSGYVGAVEDKLWYELLKLND